MTEHQIIAGCKKGDRKAHAELYNRYRSQLFGVCLRYASSREEAKDWLQDGFVQIFKDLYQYKPTGPLGGWMRRVMINVALQHIRSKKRLFPTVEISQIQDQFETDENLFSTFRAKALMQMVQQLPDGYRAVFNLYVIEGYTHKEIAKELGISPATSKSQLSRAKMALRKRIEEVV